MMMRFFRGRILSQLIEVRLDMRFEKAPGRCHVSVAVSVERGPLDLADAEGAVVAPGYGYRD
jgi:hypothetical protein